MFYSCDKCTFRSPVDAGEEVIIKHIEVKHNGDADASVSFYA